MPTPAQQMEAQIQQLKDVAAAAQSKLRELGALGGDRKPRKSPDDGPPSEAHMWLTPVMNDTVTVMLKGADGQMTEAVIRADRFDKRIHEVVKDPYEEERPAPSSPSGVRLSSESRDDLLKMTVSALRALPECKQMEEIPSLKADIVEGILEVRQAAFA